MLSRPYKSAGQLRHSSRMPGEQRPDAKPTVPQLTESLLPPSVDPPVDVLIIHWIYFQHYSLIYKAGFGFFQILVGRENLLFPSIHI